MNAVNLNLWNIYTSPLHTKNNKNYYYSKC